MEVFLGVKRHKLSKYVTDVFIDVRDLARHKAHQPTREKVYG
jgi:hypothetical protein